MESGGSSRAAPGFLEDGARLWRRPAAAPSVLSVPRKIGGCCGWPGTTQPRSGVFRQALALSKPGLEQMFPVMTIRTVIERATCLGGRCRGKQRLRPTPSSKSGRHPRVATNPRCSRSNGASYLVMKSSSLHHRTQHHLAVIHRLVVALQVKRAWLEFV